MCRRARLRRLTTLKRDAKISLRPVPQLEKLKFLHDWGAEIRIRRMPPHKVAAVACWVLVAPKWNICQRAAGDRAKSLASRPAKKIRLSASTR
jgi:hypothetical protein